MNILGVSAFYHESACSLFRDGQLIAMAAEERFSRIKHDSRLPTQAFRYCLKQAGLNPGDIDCVAYYEMPEAKLARQLSQGMQNLATPGLAWLDCEQPLRMIREYWGYGGPLRCFPHHLSHGASSFFFSGFDEAAVMVVDGVGEWATTSYGRGSGKQLELFAEVTFPHSIGLWYAAITAYLGFRVNNGEYKVMGLAPYGKPRYLAAMRDMIVASDGPGLEMDLTYFDYVSGRSMFSAAMEKRLGQSARKPHEPIEAFHCDVAKSLQCHLEDLLLKKTRYLYEKVGSSNLCLAGGVALNCVANGKIRREGPFENLFIQPAAGDDGGCLGAAALAHIELTDSLPNPRPLQHTFWGPEWSNYAIERLLNATGVPFHDFRGRHDQLLERVVEALVDFQIAGWFHGRMEMGPRALGSRCILANPMDPNVRERLNALVKKRESFRPFAPSVLASQAHHHFNLKSASPFMLETCQVTSVLDLPGITHVDGSARPQTVEGEFAPRYAQLIQAFFEKTNCPLLVNTSFNLRGEPIVCSPVEALRCAVRANLNILVLGDFLIDLDQIPKAWPLLAEYWPAQAGGGPTRKPNALIENLYSFV